MILKAILGLIGLIILIGLGCFIFSIIEAPTIEDDV